MIEIRWFSVRGHQDRVTQTLPNFSRFLLPSHPRLIEVPAHGFASVFLQLVCICVLHLYYYILLCCLRLAGCRGASCGDDGTVRLWDVRIGASPSAPAFGIFLCADWLGVVNAGFCFHWKLLSPDMHQPSVKKILYHVCTPPLWNDTCQSQWTKKRSLLELMNFYLFILSSETEWIRLKFTTYQNYCI